MTTMTSREFNQDVGRAKREARRDPVFVTDRGRPSHVLMSYNEYRKLTGQGQNIVDLLAIAEDTGTGEDFAPVQETETTETWDSHRDFDERPF